MFGCMVKITNFPNPNGFSFKFKVIQRQADILSAAPFWPRPAVFGCFWRPAPRGAGVLACGLVRRPAATLPLLNFKSEISDRPPPHRSGISPGSLGPIPARFACAHSSARQRPGVRAVLCRFSPTTGRNSNPRHQPNHQRTIPPFPEGG